MINRNHKDRLFIKLFGSEENKNNLLDLYNALNDTAYTDAAELTISTIDNVIYMGYKNDISFLISNEMALYEHMSTYNRNMPIRGLIYFAKQYEKYIVENEIDLYSSRLAKMPNPRYYIFYNGERDTEDEEILRLSSAFIKGEKPADIECVAHLLNINYGRNKKLLEHCKILEEYAILIKTIRENIAQEANRESAIMKAVDECIDKGVLRNFLLAHKAEVIGMLLTEFNEEKYISNLKKEYIEEGEEIGQKRGEEIGQKRGEEIGQKRGEEIGERRGMQKAQQLSIKIIQALKSGKTAEVVAKELDADIKDVLQLKEAIK